MAQLNQKLVRLERELTRYAERHAVRCRSCRGLPLVVFEDDLANLWPYGVDARVAARCRRPARPCRSHGSGAPTCSQGCRSRPTRCSGNSSGSCFSGRWRRSPSEPTHSPTSHVRCPRSAKQPARDSDNRTSLCNKFLSSPGCVNQHTESAAPRAQGAGLDGPPPPRTSTERATVFSGGSANSACRRIAAFSGPAIRRTGKSARTVALDGARSNFHRRLAVRSAETTRACVARHQSGPGRRPPETPVQYRRRERHRGCAAPIRAVRYR